MSHESFKAIQKYKKENAIKYGLIVSNPSKINAKYIFNTYFQTLSSNNYQIKRENHYEFTAQNCQNLTISIMIISNIDKIKEKYSTVNFFMLFIDMEDLNVINFLDKSLDTIISADDDFNKKCYILGFFAKDRKIVSNDRITNIIEAKGIDYYFTDIKNEDESIKNKFKKIIEFIVNDSNTILVENFLDQKHSELVPDNSNSKCIIL